MKKDKTKICNWVSFLISCSVAVIMIICLILSYANKKDKEKTPLEWCVIEVLEKYSEENNAGYSYEEITLRYDIITDYRTYRYVIYVYYKAYNLDLDIALWKDTWLCDVLAPSNATHFEKGRLDREYRCIDSVIIED